MSVRRSVCRPRRQVHGVRPRRWMPTLPRETSDCQPVVERLDSRGGAPAEPLKILERLYFGVPFGRFTLTADHGAQPLCRGLS